jgi:hypothetical protein
MRSYSTNSLNQTRRCFLFHHPKSNSTISWTQFTNCFDHVRCSNSCRSSTAFIIFKIFTAIPKSWTPLKNQCTRKSIVTISLFYQLESFSSCFAHLEIKPNVCPLLHHYEKAQWSAWYKILNMTEHKWQERSDWPCIGNTMEEPAYTDKLKHVPTCF